MCWHCTTITSTAGGKAGGEGGGGEGGGGEEGGEGGGGGVGERPTASRVRRKALLCKALLII